MTEETEEMIKKFLDLSHLKNVKINYSPVSAPSQESIDRALAITAKWAEERVGKTDQEIIDKNMARAREMRYLP